MLLVLSNSKDVTADYLCGKLKEVTAPFVRFDTDVSLPVTSVHFSLDKIYFTFDGTRYPPQAFSHVWYRRPEKLRHAAMPDSPEGKYTLDEWADAIEGLLAHIPKERWMNHPACNARASRKLAQLSAARSCDLLVPDTLVTQDPDELRGFYARHKGRVVAKPMSTGYVERPDQSTDLLIYTNRVTLQDLEDLSDLPACPALFQEYIDKISDVRITVVDQNIHAVELLAKESDGSVRCDVRRDNMAGVEYRRVSPPPDLLMKLARLLNCYSLRYAAIDMAVGRDGGWYFLEINPNGQWAWLDLYGGMQIAQSFIKSFST